MSFLDVGEPARLRSGFGSGGNRRRNPQRRALPFQLFGSFWHPAAQSLSLLALGLGLMIDGFGFRASGIKFMDMG